MTNNAKDIMKGILGAYGVICAAGIAIGGVVLAVTSIKAKKAMKEFEKMSQELNG